MKAWQGKQPRAEKGLQAGFPARAEVRKKARAREVERIQVQSTRASSD